MKKSQLKFNVRRLTTCTAIVLAGMLASCSNEGNDPEQPAVSTGNTEILKLISGADQTGRIKHATTTKAFMKWQRLAYVGTIEPVEEKATNDWSATAVAFNADGTKAYVSWHSNRQAKNPAEVWGGAVDVVDASSLKLEVTALSDTLKFNHVLYDGGYLFLASTSARNAGSVGRIALTNDGFAEKASVDIIGFPGVSVNAVAKANDGNLVAVSGYAGTYAKFAPNIDPQPYYYGKDEGKNLIEATVNDKFGGKYVTTDGNDVYVLYNTDNATIEKVGSADKWEIGVGLVSSLKASESYDVDTKEWLVSSSNKQTYFGKHVFAVKGEKAYVACGKNGLVVYDLNAKKVLCKVALNTIGVCADGDYVYAATEEGLKVYNWNNGAFDVCAYEVKDYKDGIPASKDIPTVGTEDDEERHSPNFVAVNPKNGEIYVAYGQSGVRVYKFRPEEPAPAE